MPLIKSAKKALRQSLKKRQRNTHYKSAFREMRKEFEVAIGDKNLKIAKEVFVKLQSNIDKLTKKNIIHRNTASRKKSRFSRLLKELSTK